jgi:hypothetical protein
MAPRNHDILEVMSLTASFQFISRIPAARYPLDIDAP